MMEDKSKDLKGIDETIIFQRLWKKRIFIFIVTALCAVVGVVSVRYHPKVYTVSVDLKFEKGEHDYMDRFFKHGKVDITRYAVTGRIEKSNFLKFTPEEATWLKELRKDVWFDVSYPESRFIVLGKTTDTLELAAELNRLGSMLQRQMTALHEEFWKDEADSMRVDAEKIRVILEKRVKELIEYQDENHSSSDMETRVKMKLSEAEFLTSSELREMERLQEGAKKLSKVKITLSSPKVELDIFQLGERSLLMRWVFFGFVGSCIWVLGYHQALVLLRKRRG